MRTENHREGVLGVLGGMGPQATNTFYQRLIDRTQAEKDQEHLQVLIWSDAKIPDRTAGILAGAEEAEKVYQALLAGAKLLEGAGCTVLAIPCNTSHYFADRLQGQLKIPLIHMIRETAAALKRQGRTRPGILATDGTIRSGLYQKEFAALGITAVTPSPAAQKLVMSLIYDDVKSGRDGDPQKFAAIHRDLEEQGCDCGVLACTELSVYRTYHSLPDYYLDAMDVLAEECITACGYKLRMV